MTSYVPSLSSVLLLPALILTACGGADEGGSPAPSGSGGHGAVLGGATGVEGTGVGGGPATGGHGAALGGSPSSTGGATTGVSDTPATTGGTQSTTGGNPTNTGGALQHTGGTHSNTGGIMSSSGGAQSSAGGTSPNSGGTSGNIGGNSPGTGGSPPNFGGTPGNAGGADSGSGGSTSSGGGADASTGGFEQSTGGNPPNTGGAGMGGTSGSPGGDPSDTSAELVAGLTLGWNLGNSLDAPEEETAWGNPLVTAALLRAVADSGFDIVRIPVTWSLHTGGAPDYRIDEAFLNRVAEVIGYVIDTGMHAIINLHHDGADALDGVEWLTLNDSSGAVTEANNAAVRSRFVAIWTQLAARYADFGNELLFESMNEIHDGYDAPETVYYDIINDLNQAFVDTVRASGGNNAQRHLIVPGYNTNIEYTLAGFELPSDVTPDHLILSVHYYDPWNYAGAASTHTWGAASPGSDTWGQEDSVVQQFDRLKSSFVNQGVPVVIGEYGAVNQTGYEDYRRYYMEYVTKAAVDRGILPIYWDNGGMGSGEDAFGLIDRRTGEIAYPAILDAMLRAATESYSLSGVALPTP